MSATQKKIFAIVVITLILTAIIWLSAGMITKNDTYGQLEKAVAAQTFANTLNDPKRSSIECYPDGKSSTCLALTYTISASACQDIVASIGGTAKEGTECNFSKFTRNYQGMDVTYIIGKASDGTYRLTVSESNNLQATGIK